MERTGKCLCGAVRFTVEVEPGLSACHCDMCRRWVGGPMLSVMARDLRWDGEEHVRIYASTDWAERGFCERCGTGLLWRITTEGPHRGLTSVPLGTLDDQAGFHVTREWFIDKKPDAYDLAGERERVTEAQALAMFNNPPIP